MLLGGLLKTMNNERKIAKLIMEDIEKETRVEMKPVPPSQLDRIERMLKWLVIKNQIDYFANVGIHCTSDQRERCKKDIKSLGERLPDIHDIIPVKKP